MEIGETNRPQIKPRTIFLSFIGLKRRVYKFVENFRKKCLYLKMKQE